MLKIYYNEKSGADIKIKLTIKDEYVKIEAEEPDMGRSGADVIECALPYNSYVLTDHSGGSVKIYRQITRSDYQWLDVNRLGVAIRQDFADIVQLYGRLTIAQVDTGRSPEEDMVVRLFTAKDKDSITIDADREYTLETFSSDDLALGDHPRMALWDSYSLTTAGEEYKANRKGFLTEDSSAAIIPAAEVIPFTIRKYKGAFEELRTDDADAEEVFVETSAGCLDTRRVRLESGVGHFNLITFGYTGPVKIKLGRKWYEVWNDYGLTIGDA